MAASVNIIMPYYPYSRSDKKDEPRAPISAKLLANLLESTKIDRLVSIDLHAAQIQGFLDTPFDNLYSAILVIDKLESGLFENRHFLPQTFFLGNDLTYYSFYSDIKNIKLFEKKVNDFFKKNISFPKLQTGGSKISVSLNQGQKKLIEKIYQDDFRLIENHIS